MHLEMSAEVLNENKCVIIISGILSSGSRNGRVWSLCEATSVVLLGLRGRRRGDSPRHDIRSVNIYELFLGLLS